MPVYKVSVRRYQEINYIFHARAANEHDLRDAIDDGLYEIVEAYGQQEGWEDEEMEIKSVVLLTGSVVPEVPPALDYEPPEEKPIVEPPDPRQRSLPFG